LSFGNTPAKLAMTAAMGSDPAHAESKRRLREPHMPRHRNIVLGLAMTLVSGIAVVAQQPVTPQPSPAHKKLAAFVGTWKDEAEIKPGPLGPGGKMSLTETCNWFTGGFSIVCYSETTGVMGDLKALAVFSYDPEEKVYRLYEFNSVGRSGAAKGTVDGDTWTFDGESKMGDKLIKTRSTIRILSPDSAVMKSEVSMEGGPMTLLMDLKGSRVKQALSNFNSCVHGASEGWPFECFQNLQSR
jgi:Protein of unknown function (DUF1579)